MMRNKHINNAVDSFRNYSKSLLFLLLVLSSVHALAQASISEVLKQYNNNTVPYISVEALAKQKTNAIIFDAREREEYEVSHLKEAIYVGYSDFDIAAIENTYPNKNKQIVVYCSLGVRSERIGEKLQKAGFKNVYNLHGGIFEWKNKLFSIIDSEAKETEKVHAYNKQWGKWLNKGEKVYPSRKK